MPHTTTLHTPMTAQLSPLDPDARPPSFGELMGEPTPDWSRDVWWVVGGMLLMAVLLALGLYGVLEALSGSWMGR